MVAWFNQYWANLSQINKSQFSLIRHDNARTIMLDNIQ